MAALWSWYWRISGDDLKSLLLILVKMKTEKCHAIRINFTILFFIDNFKKKKNKNEEIHNAWKIENIKNIKSLQIHVKAQLGSQFSFFKQYL